MEQPGQRGVVLPGPPAFCVRRTQHRRQLHRIQLPRRVHHKRVNAVRHHGFPGNSIFLSQPVRHTLQRFKRKAPLPELRRARQRLRFPDVKYIFEPPEMAVRVRQRDGLRVRAQVTLHPRIPHLFRRARRGLRLLRVDQYLLRKAVFVQPRRGVQERPPRLPVNADLKL